MTCFIKMLKAIVSILRCLVGYVNSPTAAEVEDAICSLVSKPSLWRTWYVDTDLITAAVDGDVIPVDLDDNEKDNSGHGLSLY